MVVLYGYVGSSPRVLEKYVQALCETGKTRLVYHTTAPTLDVFCRPGNMRRLAEASLNLLSERHAGEPVVIMAMSNGGAFVYANILRLLSEDGARPRDRRRYSNLVISGVVFDSAPAYMTVDSGALAVSAGIKNSWARTIAYWIAYCLLPVMLVVLIGSDGPRRFYALLAADPLPAPVLYIYSAHDKLTDVGQLDALIEQRRARHPQGPGAVRTLRIGELEALSPHVAHLIKHPERYRAAILELLDVASRT